MSTYTSSLHHIVFATKYRRPVLEKAIRSEIQNYIWKLCENLRCQPNAIGGVEDHIHIALSIHPSMPVSELVKTIKISSSIFIKDKKHKNNFIGWQEGYGHFTHSIQSKSALVAYVLNQEEHHKRNNSIDELKKLLFKFEIVYDPRYLN